MSNTLPVQGQIFDISQPDQLIAALGAANNELTKAEFSYRKAMDYRDCCRRLQISLQNEVKRNEVEKEASHE